MFPVHPDAPAFVTADTFARKLTRALNNGVKIVQTLDGRRYATSVSRPGVIHPLGLGGCSCEDFHYSGSCMHHALNIVTLFGFVEAE